MFKEERRRNILATLERERKVIASELSEALQISGDTVRRDLNEMAATGLLKRVHGGALPPAPTLIPYRVREQESNAAKAAIAAACVGLLRSGQVIIIDSGTTALRIAQELPLDLEVTVVTNSVPVLDTLSSHPRVEVIGIGGSLFKDIRCTVGAQAVSEFRAINADVCILGLNAIHPEVGLCVLEHESMLVKTAMIQGARQVVAVTASDKLGTIGPFVFGPLSALTHLVTDSNASEETLAPYHNAGIIVLIGEVPDRTGEVPDRTAD
ncbi:MAG: DeoR/GlpR family DNA-binding transcription regulator [Janthinobacterium lividum]